MYKSNLFKKLSIFNVLMILFLFQNNLSAQRVIFEKEIGHFVNAESFSINSNGFIFVTDIERDEISKIDQNGKVQQFIGGYGWSPGTFDQPVDVFASTLSVYVTDKNNDRVQFFDRDLNYVSQLRSEELRNENAFRYPTSAVVSPIGDFFILDSDNSRILKFDLNGNFTNEIGSYDAGMFALENPLKFDISADSRLFVLDGNSIKIFDQFGGGLNILRIDSGAVNIHIRSGYLLVVYSNKLLLLNLKEYTTGFQEIMLAELFDLKDAAIFNGKLFALTSSSVLIYNFIEN